MTMDQHLRNRVLTLDGPLSVSCPRCGATPGLVCRSRHGTAAPPHAARRRLSATRSDDDRLQLLLGAYTTLADTAPGDTLWRDRAALVREVIGMDDPTTPTEVDGRIADLERLRISVYGDLDQVLDDARRTLGEIPLRPATTHRPAVWRSSPGQVRQRMALADRTTAAVGRERLALVDSTIRLLGEQIADLQGRHASRPWARYYLVTSSSYGRIHSSRQCRQCAPTTIYRWLPELAGAPAATVVAKYGPRLCSVCHPTAPPEWTRGAR